MDCKDVMLKQLSGLINTSIKIRDGGLNCHVFQTFQECLQISLNLKNFGEIKESNDHIFEINSVLDYLHEELNTGHWSKVPIESRQNFTIGSFVKALLILRHVENPSHDVLKRCLKSLDMGLLLGAPLDESPELLSEAAKYLQLQLNVFEPEEKYSLENEKKRKLENECFKEQLDKLDGVTIEELNVPSIETFNRRFFIPQYPVKLKGCMTHWPASTKWLDMNYLLKVAGNRTVPIEIGSHYTDQNWSQKLMTLGDFISKHYLSESGDIGYLAQHNLFDQISELKGDIRVPEYCCCSLNYEESSEPDINAWLGPKGTVSPLHQDPKNNILTQIYGTKRLLLFAPKDSDYLYPHAEAMLSNTAQVDPLNPDYSKFPEYKKATMYKCLLEPGEMLFIPVKWWHHVTALEKSFSVSFWWQ